MKGDSWRHGGIFDDEDVKIRLEFMHAVDKSLDQITVTELCEKTGIARQVFYKYFDSKYSLHWWWPTFIHRFYLNEVGRTIDIETGYFHHIRLLSMEKEFFQIATQYTLASSCLRSPMPQYRKMALLETLQDYRLIDVDDELLFCLEAWVKIETETLTEWYRQGTTPEPHEAVERILSIFPPRLYDVLSIE